MPPFMQDNETADGVRLHGSGVHCSELLQLRLPGEVVTGQTPAAAMLDLSRPLYSCQGHAVPMLLSDNDWEQQGDACGPTP